MRIPKRASLVAPLLASMLTVTAVWAFAPGPSQKVPEHPNQHLRITGHVNQLYPGKTSKLVLHVRNPMAFSVKVTRLTVRVGMGTGPHGQCAAQTLRVHPWTGHRRIPTHASRKLRLPVKMRHGAPNACIGTKYLLTYYAKAVR